MVQAPASIAAGFVSGVLALAGLSLAPLVVLLSRRKGGLSERNLWFFSGTTSDESGDEEGGEKG